jgi:GxxExxY protein
MNINDITERIIGAAIEVHRHLGPGLLEGVYEECLSVELELRSIPFTRQQRIPVRYKGRSIAADLKIDLLVHNAVVVELKSIEKIHPIHAAQLLTYLRLTNRRVGLLINFNVPILHDGVKRVANNL